MRWAQRRGGKLLRQITADAVDKLLIFLVTLDAATACDFHVP